MNSISIYIEEYRDANILIKDGINFNNIEVIKILIDGEDIEEDKHFSDAMIYWRDLSLSYHKTGQYLIFTCACGIADDGGWEGVYVTVDDKHIRWELEVGNKIYAYKFDKEQYISEIKSVKDFLKSNAVLTLEPRTVVYPEGWNKLL